VSPQVVHDGSPSRKSWLDLTEYLANIIIKERREKMRIAVDIEEGTDYSMSNDEIAGLGVYDPH
jgi:hypothetical protein